MDEKPAQGDAAPAVRLDELLFASHTAMLESDAIVRLVTFYVPERHEEWALVWSLDESGSSPAVRVVRIEPAKSLPTPGENA